MVKGKKGKGKGKKKEVAPPEPPSEFDTLPTEVLKERLVDLKAKLDRAQLDRNQDTIQTFYDISKKELGDVEMHILGKDREMEMMEENHRVEVRVYVQKVKHLEYEHGNTTQKITEETTEFLTEEDQAHDQTEVDMRKGKRELKQTLRESEAAYAEEIRNLKQLQRANLDKYKQSFAMNLRQLSTQHEDRLERLRRDLDLRRKVEIHELEERKNLHINDLINGHEEAFAEIKKYYNDITRDNIKLIKSLKAEIAEMKKKASANQKLMMDIAAENKRLSEPLKVALAEVESLRSDLKDAEKDRMSLKNAKARLRATLAELRQLQSQEVSKEDEFARVEGERDELLEKFEDTLRAVQEKADFKNFVLERAVARQRGDIDQAEAQWQQILKTAQLDPVVMDDAARRIDEMLSQRNAVIRELEYNVARVTKAHNDALRVYQSKLGELGIDEDTGARFIPSNTAVGPAGLVAKPTV